MKKSTLITTIAMIVVVVVALSTATYAWFTSSSATTVNSTLSTTSAAGLTVMGGSVTLSGTGYNIQYSSSQDIGLRLLNGLYSPTAEITAELSAGGLTTVFSPYPTFYTAKQVGATATSGATVDSVATSSVPADLATISSTPNILRLVNTYGEQKNVNLVIYVVAKYATDASYLAAIGFETYIAYYASTGSECYTAYTGYNYGSIALNASGSYEATKNGSAEAAGLTLGYDTNASSEPSAFNGVLSTGFLTLAEDKLDSEGTTLISAGAYYYTLTLSLGSIASNAAVDFAFYSWFDGWELFNTAANTHVDIIYAFEM